MPYRSLSRPGRQVSAQAFHMFLCLLVEGEAVILQMVHDLRTVAETEVIGTFRLRSERLVAGWLENLLMLGMIRRQDGYLSATWMGAGVANWRQQIIWARELGCLEQIPEPRLGENGDLPASHCQEFRATLFAPGYCWCCRAQSEHFSEFLRAAEQLIRP